MSGPSAQDIARSYVRRPWAPIPIPYKSKIPVLKGWPKLRVTEENIEQDFKANGKPQNIGVLTGQPSGGLNDVDMDCVEALALAPYFLPKTAARFGRRSKPESPQLYRAGIEKKITFNDPLRPENEQRLLEV